MDTKRDTRDMATIDRPTFPVATLRDLIEAELALDPDTDSDLWDLYEDAA